MKLAMVISRTNPALIREADRVVTS